MTEVDRLRAELAAAQEQIARLAEENDRLREGRVPVAVVAHRSERAPTLFPGGGELSVGVNQGSSSGEKIALYRSLFAGRSDVYASRWENTASGKSGWAPAKAGRSASGRYLPLDDGVVGSHLAGRTTAGLYPLIDGDRCWLLACDFDKGSWMLDALAFVRVCAEVGVPAVLERSRSGNGAHVWI